MRGEVIMQKNSNRTQLVIITGMSGAGKTVAIQSFEDLGYFCIDNLPPSLVPKFLSLLRDSTNDIKKIALVMDLRGREFFDSMFDALDQLAQEEWLQEQMIYLDANDETLIRRYKETRRSHPLANDGLPLEGIKKERDILSELRGRVKKTIDTTRLTPKQLREKIINLYSTEDQAIFSVNFVSFGFKHGILLDADLVFDVRFLPNPHYVPHLQPLTGLNPDVASYVMKWPETKVFYEKLIDFLKFLLPQYREEGKTQLVIAIGCTGGQHRSVTLAEDLAKQLASQFATHATHRDIEQ